MRQWLARLSFSLLVLAFVLAWEGYRVATGAREGGAGKVALCYVGAAVLAALGFAGVRERHRGE